MVATLVVGTNTYQLQADADALLEDDVSTGAWSFLDSDTKDRCLITAFKLLETQTWQGDKTGGDAQTAQHPRTGLVNCNGDAISDSTTAPDILNAHAQLSYELSQDPSLAGSANTGSNVKKLKAASASIEFFQRTDDEGAPTSRFPSRIQELISCYLAGGTGGNEAFGTGADSIFDECDTWGRTNPF